MSSTSAEGSAPITTKELVKQFQEMRALLKGVKEENEQLKAQLAAEKSPSPTTSEEKDADLRALIKALTVQSEKKAKIPEPHEWDGAKKKL